MGSITGVGLTMLKSKSYNPSTPLVFGRASLNGGDVVGNLADGEKKQKKGDNLLIPPESSKGNS